MKERKILDKCKKCKLLSRHGIKDGKYNKWCCHYGKPSYKAISHCNLEEQNK